MDQHGGEPETITKPLAGQAAGAASRVRGRRVGGGPTQESSSPTLDSSLASLFLQEDEHALLVADDDVRLAVLVHVAGSHLGADAAVVIDLMRDEFRAAFAVNTIYMI